MVVAPVLPVPMIQSEQVFKRVVDHFGHLGFVQVGCDSDLRIGSLAQDDEDDDDDEEDDEDSEDDDSVGFASGLP